MTIETHEDHPLCGPETNPPDRSHIMSEPMLHVEMLSGRNVYQLPISVIVIWADRSYDRCPGCGEHIEAEITSPPVTLNGVGHAEEYDHAHPHCGAWLPIHWVALSDDADERVVGDAGIELATAWRKDREERIATIRGRLAAQLRDVVEGREDPTGTETEPGVYRDGDYVVAWTYGLRDGDPLIEVHPEEDHDQLNQRHSQ